LHTNPNPGTNGKHKRKCIFNDNNSYKQLRRVVFMAKNAELEEIVLKKMAFRLKDEPSVRLMMEGDEEGTKELIKAMGQLQVDKDYKIRFNFSNIIGYGYDFNKTTEEGTPAKEVYEHAVKNTKKLGGSPHFETFLDEGIIDNQFGWYLTSF
jgi:hypothetical protein